MTPDTNGSLWPAAGATHNLCMASQSKKIPEAVEAGKKIRALRDAQGMTLADLSSAIGGVLSGPRIGNYEQGTRKLTVRDARILATALDAHPAYLLGLLDEEQHRFLLALRAQGKPGVPAPFLEVEPSKPARKKRVPLRNTPY